MITLVFAQMVYYFAIFWPAYGGEDVLSILVRNQFPGVNTMRPLGFFFICYVVLLAALGLFVLLRGSRFGSALQAARQNEVRVATVGIAPFRIRLTAFAISARSEEHTSELQSLMRISYAVFCLQKKKTNKTHQYSTHMMCTLLCTR